MIAIIGSIDRCRGRFSQDLTDTTDVFWAKPALRVALNNHCDRAPIPFQVGSSLGVQLPVKAGRSLRAL